MVETGHTEEFSWVLSIDPQCPPDTIYVTLLAKDVYQVVSPTPIPRDKIVRAISLISSALASTET